MRVEKISGSNHLLRITDTDFMAEICFNPRDSACSALVLTLPDDPLKRAAQSNAFIQFLKEEVGGRILIQFPHSQDVAALPEAEYKKNAKYMSEEKINNAFKKINSPEFKEKIRLKQSALNNFQPENVYVLSAPAHYEAQGKDIYAQLVKFKHANASFANEKKITAGYYGEEAEKRKIKNRFVTHLALYNTVTKEFLGTLQIFLHNGMAYFSDLIIHKEMLNHGLAQQLMAEASEIFCDANNQMQFKKAWFIAGGGEAAGEHLYDDLLNGEEMTTDLQKNLGLYMMNAGRPKKLLEAAFYSDSPFLERRAGEEHLKSKSIFPQPIYTSRKKMDNDAQQSLYSTRPTGC